MNTFSLPLIKIDHVASDVYSFYFDRTKSDFTFLPGQYIEMKLEIKKADDRGNTRNFTIASSPTETSFLLITARVVQSAFKETLLNLKSGQNVDFSGPYGNFVFDQNDIRHKVFLAGGIGVTPFRSMALFAKAVGYNHAITLFTSFRVLADTMFFEAFKGLEETLPTFKFIPTITKPDATDEWPGETGRIDASMISKYIENPQNAMYYIVGPQQMVDSMMVAVLSLGVPREQIKFENFTGY